MGVESAEAGRALITPSHIHNIMIQSLPLYICINAAAAVQLGRTHRPEHINNSLVVQHFLVLLLLLLLAINLLSPGHDYYFTSGSGVPRGLGDTHRQLNCVVNYNEY